MSREERAVDVRLRTALADQNPWWTTGTVPKTHLREYKRRDFFALRKKLDDDKILAIVGPRRVGKTTVMYQLIDDLLTVRRIEPRRVLFISLDYPNMMDYLEYPYEQIMSSYTESVLREPLSDLSSRVYIFLDEVYSMPGWAKALKGHYDRATNTKVVISGSGSVDIVEGAARALVGRVEMPTMLPLKFADVVQYVMGDRADVKDTSLGTLRKGFAKALEDGSPEELYRAYEAGFTSLAGLEPVMQGHLLEYLMKDGYPENLGQPDPITCARTILQSLDLSIYKDIVRIFKDREPDDLRRLLLLIAQSSGNVQSLNSMAQSLGRNNRTVEKYIWHLKSVFLLSESRAYSPSPYKSLRRPSKIYVSNVGVRNAVLSQLNERLKNDLTQLGRCAEIVALDHISRLKFCLEPTGPANTFYWRKKEDLEVDVIVEMLGKVVPFDVRFREKTDERDLRALHAFMAEHPRCPFGVLLTKKELARKGDIVLIPLWLFALT